MPLCASLRRLWPRRSTAFGAQLQPGDFSKVPVVRGAAASAAPGSQSGGPSTAPQPLRRSPRTIGPGSIGPHTNTTLAQLHLGELLQGSQLGTERGDCELSKRSSSGTSIAAATILAMS